MFILADGAGVGLAIYKAIAANNTVEAKKISDSINRSIANITNALTEENIEIVFAGGDDIFCQADNPHKIDRAIFLIKEIFQRETSLDIDIALGETPLEAAKALDSLKTKKRLNQLLS